MKKFSCFPKQFFFSICFIRYVEHSFDRRTKHFLRNYRIWSKKCRQRMQKCFKTFFSKCSPGEVESSFKTSWNSSDSQMKFFRSIFKKKTNCNFWREKKFLRKFLLKKRIQFCQGAEVLLTKRRETFRQCPKKKGRKTC